MMFIALGIFLIVGAVGMVWRFDFDNPARWNLADFFTAQRAGMTLYLGFLCALLGAAAMAGR